MLPALRRMETTHSARRILYLYLTGTTWPLWSPDFAPCSNLLRCLLTKQAKVRQSGGGQNKSESINRSHPWLTVCDRAGSLGAVFVGQMDKLPRTKHAGIVWEARLRACFANPTAICQLVAARWRSTLELLYPWLPLSSLAFVCLGSWLCQPRHGSNYDFWFLVRLLLLNARKPLDERTVGNLKWHFSKFNRSWIALELFALFFLETRSSRRVTVRSGQHAGSSTGPRNDPPIGRQKICNLSNVVGCSLECASFGFRAIIEQPVSLLYYNNILR